jgi:nucleoside-diphosphate-sugar epimerase
MSIIVALSGVSGAMGGEALAQLLDSPLDLTIRVFEWNQEKKRTRFYRETLKKGRGKIEICRGDLSEMADCRSFIKGATYVLHCAALIPPRSDHDEEGAYRSDFLATKNLVDAINESPEKDMIKFVNIGTVAEYGSRTTKTMWGRVGDPIISSDYDVYSLNKIKAERYLLDHKPPHFVSLRQTAIAHKYLFKNNMSDGLMFHTLWNGPLEWVSDEDSGRLLKHLVEEDQAGQLNDFWDRIYNIGGGYSCRATGYESVNDGFEIMGKSAAQCYEPNWNAARNFHGMYFLDSDVLENYLHFRRDSLKDFWAKMLKRYPYLRLARIVPSFLIKDLGIKPLLRNDNAPVYWLKHHEEGKIKAFFGGKQAYEAIPKHWRDYPLLSKNQTPDGLAFDSEASKHENWAKEQGQILNHGFDESKKPSELTLEDMKQAAHYRGGECLSETMEKGDLWTPLKWRCAEFHEFEASPFVILYGGYWCPQCEQPKPWATGRLAAHSPFFGQVYFADHSKEEAGDVFPPTDKEQTER